MKWFYRLLGLSFIIFLVSCQNPYRRHFSEHVVSSGDQTGQQAVKSSAIYSKDAFQVKANEFDEFFVMRYGLLYQKLSDVPFSGRIIKVDDGLGGNYVSADENWKNGKKDGLSTKWFSNGSKMFERNYKEGRWHGPVTRWWPNGQRMYVTAYTDGVRNSREAKWKSDGTPITPNVVGPEPIAPESVNEPLNTETAVNPSLFGEEQGSEPLTDPLPLELPSVDPVVETVVEQPVEPVLTPAIPDFPPAALPEPSDNLALPAPPSSEEIAPPTFPDSPVVIPPSDGNGLTLPETVSEPTLPDLPEAPSTEGVTDLPTLPEIPSESGDTESLPGLPSLPELGDTGDLPPMPAEEEGLPGLPPLPSPDDSGSFEDLPPLPPLP